MTLEQSRALVDAACKIPGVRDKLPADWFWPYCPTCGKEGDKGTIPSEGDREVYYCSKCDHIIEGEHAAVLRFSPDTEAFSPHMVIDGDLEDERNLWALLRIADAVLPRPITTMYMRSVDKFCGGAAYPFLQFETRTAVCIAAILMELNIPIPAP